MKRFMYALGIAASIGSLIFAIAWNSTKAAQEQGDQDLAAIWWDEFMRLAMAAWLQTMQLAMLGGGQTGGVGGTGAGGSSTPTNGAAPAAKAGLPRPEDAAPGSMGRGGRPNPGAAQAGARSNAGQPRPGAQRPIVGINAMPPWAR